MSWLFPYTCHHPVRWGGGRGGTTEEPVARLARTLATALVTADEEEGDLTRFFQSLLKARLQLRCGLLHIPETL